MSTLFLNADYTPMSVAPLSMLTWKESVKMVYAETVDVIELYSNWTVRSPRQVFGVPSIVVNKTYVKTSRSVKFNKYNLCLRDEYQCQYCRGDFDTRSLTMDHVVPKCAGGKTSFTNIVMACQACNTRKGHRTVMKPCREPLRPQLAEIVAKARRMPLEIPDAGWIPYIGWNPRLITVKMPPRDIDLSAVAV
jgi:5-methylcytosine-specific restriction endonuclease McrA